MSDQHAPVYRILDANANRAVEGLRVVEEYVRFGLDDRHLTSLCKHLRHDLAAILASLDPHRLLAARETQADIGVEVSTRSEFHRTDPWAVAIASMKRLEQSLRCLEEYGKVVRPDFAAECEKLRYRAYTLHRAISVTANSVARLAAARLYVLIDGASSEQAFQQYVTALVQAGVHVLQLRDKRLNDRELLERARLLRQLTSDTAVIFIVNDRPDIAALANADGVHIGQDELAVKDARTIVGPGKLIGVSTHSLAQAQKAVLDGANYIGCGPTFPSGTKRFDAFPGLDFLRQVAAEIRLPAFAIGGITLENTAHVFAAGIKRIAVSGVVSASNDPVNTVRQLLAQLSELFPANGA